MSPNSDLRSDPVPCQVEDVIAKRRTARRGKVARTWIDQTWILPKAVLIRTCRQPLPGRSVHLCEKPHDTGIVVVAVVVESYPTSYGARSVRSTLVMVNTPSWLCADVVVEVNVMVLGTLRRLVYRGNITSVQSVVGDVQVCPLVVVAEAQTVGFFSSVPVRTAIDDVSVDAVSFQVLHRIDVQPGVLTVGYMVVPAGEAGLPYAGWKTIVVPFHKGRGVTVRYRIVLHRESTIVVQHDAGDILGRKSVVVLVTSVVSDITVRDAAVLSSFESYAGPVTPTGYGRASDERAVADFCANAIVHDTGCHAIPSSVVRCPGIAEEAIPNDVVPTIGTESSRRVACIGATGPKLGRHALLIGDTRAILSVKDDRIAW